MLAGCRGAGRRLVGYGAALPRGVRGELILTAVSFPFLGPTPCQPLAPLSARPPLQHCKSLPTSLATSALEIVVAQGTGSGGGDNLDWSKKTSLPAEKGKGGGGGGGKMIEDDWSRGKGGRSGGPSILADGPHSKIQKAASPWMAGATLDDDARFLKRVKGILNKITPENFEKLTLQLVDLGIDTPEKLRELISEIFGKSVQEPGYCPTYSDLCKVLSERVSEFKVEGQKKAVSFKRVLLNTCQEEFTKASSKAGPPEGYAGTEAAWAMKMKNTFLGTMKLIGELGNKQMVPEKITHFCMQALLNDAEAHDDDKIEALCMMVRTVGKTLDKSERSKQLLEGYISRVKMLAQDKRLQSRIRFLLQQIVELRDNKWVPRREELQAKKISEVHKEAAAKLGVNIAGNALLAHGTSSTVNEVPLFPTGPSGLMPAPPPVLDEDGWEMSGKAGREARKQRQQYEEALRAHQARSAAQGQQADLSTGGHSALVGGGGEPAAAGGSEAPGAGEEAGAVEKPEESEEDKLARKAKNLFEEYLGIGDVKEALLCVEELPKEAHAMVVGRGLCQVLDTSKEDKRNLLTKLLLRMAGEGGEAAVEREAWLGGMEEAIQMLPDAVCDAPNATKWFGPMLGSALAAGVVEAAWVKEKIEALGEDLFEDDVAKLSEATKAGAAAAGKADLELGW